jgi:hypothetical protein
MIDKHILTNVLPIRIKPIIEVNWCLLLRKPNNECPIMNTHCSVLFHLFNDSRLSNMYVGDAQRVKV